MKKAGLKNRRIVDRGIFLFFRKENKKVKMKIRKNRIALHHLFKGW